MTSTGFEVNNTFVAHVIVSLFVRESRTYSHIDIDVIYIGSDQSV